ncbi:DUF6281 family protein [Streptomyces sp. HPF1205]|uniref:DUF6281 family protein n=1 Tax=Streptomyces sp. HPF1205 TaxID=2873262 RepID=UPI001CEDECE8|nr:DUF6281 family protein [Streptomyces sp. HPF1205]
MTAVAAAALAAACSGGGQHTADADCAWQLSYGNRLYVPPQNAAAVVQGVRHEGTALGQGSFAGCADGGDSADGGDGGEKVTVYRIKGVDPSLAVITQDDQIGVTDPKHLPPPVSALLAGR